jgi:endo-1,4-beta-mannosidase
MILKTNPENMSLDEKRAFISRMCDIHRTNTQDFINHLIKNFKLNITIEELMKK